MSQKEAFDQYYRRLAEIIFAFRERAESDVRIKEYYQLKFDDDEAFHLWDSMRIVRDKGSRAFRIVLADGAVSLAYDASDEKYNSLRYDHERVAYKKREQNLRKRGVWVTTPSFAAAPIAEQARRREENPLAGMVQLLTGAHYYLLAYLKVYDMDTKSTVAPVFNRKSAQLLEYFEVLERYPLREGEDRQGVLTAKGRGTRYTTDREGYCLNHLTAQFQDSFDVAVTIDDSKKVESHLRKVVRAYYESTPQWSQSISAHKTLGSPNGRPLMKFTSSMDIGRARISFEDERGHPTGVANSYELMGAKGKNLEGKRYPLLVAEEMGLYEYKISDYMTSAMYILRGTNQTRVGLFIGGGRANQNNADTAKSLKNMHAFPKTYGLVSFFSGKQYFKYADPETGWADEARCIKEEMEAREALEVAGDIAILQGHLESNAIHIDDCFGVGRDNHLDVWRIGRQLRTIDAKVLSGDLVIQEGMLEFDYRNPHLPIWKPKAPGEGGWLIFRQPPAKLPRRGRPASLFFAGADNFERTLTEEEARKVRESKASRLSQLSMVVLDVETEEPVAMYLYRHADPINDYDQTVLGALYYSCYCYPEKNKDGNMMHFLKNFKGDGTVAPGQFANFLYPTVQRYRTRSNHGPQFGQDTGRRKAELYLEHIVPYMDRATEKINFKRLLKDLAEWDIEEKKGTPDTGMALKMGLIGLTEFRATLARQKNAGGTLAEAYASLPNYRSTGAGVGLW